MSRRTIIKKKFPLPDPVYKNYLTSILVTKLIKKGRKNLAQAIVCHALDTISYRLQVNPIEIFEKAVKNVTPKVEVKARRLRGSTYQIPIRVNDFRGTHLALKWIIKAAKTRSGKKISVKLANEIIDAANNSGEAIRKKAETHKMAEANKAFAHFRY